MSSQGSPICYPPPLENKALNVIPVGRQLHRTPPNKTPSSRSTRPEEEPTIKHEEDSQIVSLDTADDPADDTARLSVKEERQSFRRPSITSASAKMGDADPAAFIQGMEGYQWTDVDLEFVYQARQQKQVRQLQQELSELEKTLQAENQMLELAVASRNQLRSELSKTLSCDSLLQLCRSVLARSRTSDQLEGLGDKALLSLLDIADVRRAVREEKTQVGRLEREAQELREKEEIDTYQKKISTLQANIDALNMELVELKTRLLEKEEASKAVQLQREVRKAKVISYPLAEKETEEMNTSQTPEIISQVSAKGCRASRNVRPANKTLKEKVSRETSKKITAPMKEVGRDKVKEGETAPKERASKKTRSKKIAKKDPLPAGMATTDTTSHVKTSIERDPDNMTPKLSEGFKKGQQGSSSPPKVKARKKTTSKAPKENETLSLVTTDMEMTTKGEGTPKKKTRKKPSKKDLVPDETTLNELPPKVNASNVVQVLEEGHKGPQTAKPSTRARRTRTDLRKTGEEETVKIEANEKGKTSRNVNAPKMVRAKRGRKKEKEMSPVSKIKDVIVFEETFPKVQAQDHIEMQLRASKGTAPQVKLKDTKKTVWTKSADIKLPAGLTVEAATVTKEMKPRSQRKTSKQKEVNETSRQETDDDDDDDNNLKKAYKKKTPVKNMIEEETNPEEPTAVLEKRGEEATTAKTTRKKRAAKVKTPEEETALKETRKTASKQKATNQRSGKKPSEDEVPSSTNAAQAQEEAHKAVNSSTPPVERDPGMIRRSKRNTVKSENVSSVIPQKTTRSRQR